VKTERQMRNEALITCLMLGLVLLALSLSPGNGGLDVTVWTFTRLIVISLVSALAILVSVTEHTIQAFYRSLALGVAFWMINLLWLRTPLAFALELSLLGGIALGNMMSGFWLHYQTDVFRLSALGFGAASALAFNPYFGWWSLLALLGGLSIAFYEVLAILIALPLVPDEPL